jgi:hypothetical protein
LEGTKRARRFWVQSRNETWTKGNCAKSIKPKTYKPIFNQETPRFYDSRVENVLSGSAEIPLFGSFFAINFKSEHFGTQSQKMEMTDWCFQGQAEGQGSFQGNMMVGCEPIG